MEPKEQQNENSQTGLSAAEDGSANAEALTAEPPLNAAEALKEAARLQRKGRLGEAFELCRQVKTTYPGNADAYNLGGIIAFQGGKKRRSVDLLRKAIKYEPNHAGAHNNLGIVLKETGELDEAITSFETSIRINPDDADTHFNLGNALTLLRRHSDAAAAFGRASELRPNFVEALYNRANMLAEIGRFEIAIDTFRRVIDFISDFAGAHYALGKALQCVGRHEDAIPAFEETLKFEPGHRHALDDLTVAMMRARGPEALLELCNHRLNQDPHDRIALAAKAIALHEVGDDVAARHLIDIDRFVRPVRIDVPDGFADLGAFNAALTKHVVNHPTLTFERDGNATRNGGHSGNLIREPKGPIAGLEAAIIQATKDYVAALPERSGHPFLEMISERTRRVIWAVVMQSQGHQVAHIHPQAWLSGVYYPKLPNIVKAKDAGEAGWIEFGAPPDRFECQRDPEVRTFKPEEGLMFLFPSLFYHRTIPFESDDQRISIAFDVIASD